MHSVPRRHTPKTRQAWLRRLGLFVLGGWAGTIVAQPVVSNVRAAQRPASRLVEIAYDLSNASGRTSQVTVEVSPDGGKTYLQGIGSTSGAAGTGQSAATGKVIVWDPGASWPTSRWENFRVRIVADDGTGRPYPGGFTLIPGGTFTMGDTKYEGFTRERPPHEVTLSPFYAYATEVSFSEWVAVRNSGLALGYLTLPAGQRGATIDGAEIPGEIQNILHPVTKVSWWDAVVWCNARSERDGLRPVYYRDAAFSSVLREASTEVFADWSADGYRLPTEAEWEYLARGGLHGRSHFRGDALEANSANFAQSGDPFDGTTPTAYFSGAQAPSGPDAANGYGIYDTAGNVLEWCWDWYGDYGSDAATDPRGPASGSFKVARGGAWNSDTVFIRNASRTSGSPVASTAAGGFRVVRRAPPGSIRPQPPAGAARTFAASTDFPLDLRNRSASLAAPLSTSVVAGQSLLLAGSATGASIARIEFRDDGGPLGSDSSAPYELAWTPRVPGTRRISVRAVFADGLSADSGTTTITVRSPLEGSDIAQTAGDGTTLGWYGTLPAATLRGNRGAPASVVSTRASSTETRRELVLTAPLLTGETLSAASVGELAGATWFLWRDATATLPAAVIPLSHESILSTSAQGGRLTVLLRTNDTTAQRDFPTDATFALHRHHRFDLPLTARPGRHAGGRKLILLFHGNAVAQAGAATPADPYVTTPAAELALALQGAVAGTDWTLLPVNWANSLAPAPAAAIDRDIVAASTQSAAQAYLIGLATARTLAGTYPLAQKVHLVAHGPGAWAAYATAKSLAREATFAAADIQVTLLDPLMPAEAVSVSPVFSGIETGGLGRIVIDAIDEWFLARGRATKLRLLENYYTAYLGGAAGLSFGDATGAATSQVFAWRATDVNQRIDNEVLTPLRGRTEFALGPFYAGVPGADALRSSILGGHTFPASAYAQSVAAPLPLLSPSPWSRSMLAADAPATLSPGALATPPGTLLSASISAPGGGAAFTFTPGVPTVTWLNLASSGLVSGFRAAGPGDDATVSVDFTSPDGLPRTALLPVAVTAGTAGTRALATSVHGESSASAALGQTLALTARFATDTSGAPVSWWFVPASASITSGIPVADPPDGSILLAGTGSTLSLAIDSAAHAGRYRASAETSTGTAWTGTLDLQVATSGSVPAILQGPTQVAVDAGSPASFEARFTEGSGTTVTWQQSIDSGASWVPVSGATVRTDADTSTLAFASVGTAQSGLLIRAVAANAFGAAASTPASLTVTPGGRLVNLAVRATLDGSTPLIIGFVTAGGAKPVLLRAAGPALAGVLDGWAPDPRLDLFSGQTVAGANDNWPESLQATFASLGAFPFTTGSADAALLASVNGARTAHIASAGAGTVLVELYDAAPADGPRLVNVSARSRAGSGAQTLIAGFVVAGPAPRNVLIRAVGPGLTSLGVPGALANPLLTVFNAAGEEVRSNDNWSPDLDPVFAAAGAFPLTPGSADAAVLVQLPPGAYTVHVRGDAGAEGEALVEIYDIP